MSGQREVFVKEGHKKEGRHRKHDSKPVVDGTYFELLVTVPSQRLFTNLEFRKQLT